MQTRGGECYPKVMNSFTVKRRKIEVRAGGEMSCRKRSKISADTARGSQIPGGCDFFDGLPDDILLYILCKFSASASCPADFFNVLITCKRFNKLGLHPLVLSRACGGTLAVRAENWSDSAHRFLKLCADSGNLESCFILGMIRFYCLQNRGSGASLMARAAIGNHPSALYSLAVIQFNGSGGSKNDKDLRAGVALCARAAFLGHVDSLRELGHCLQDGYGVKQNIVEGRRLLVQANARELAHVLVACPTAVVPSSCLAWNPPHHHMPGACSSLRDFGCNLLVPEVHPVNRFLSDWFSDRVGNAPGSELRLCSHSGCGRPETRRHEFRRCSVCGAVNYCSRACQALDWKMRHKADCAPVDRWVDDDGENEDDGNGNFNGEDNGNGEMVES